MIARAGALALAALSLLACEQVVRVGGDFQLLLDVPTEPVRAVDVLFVVDTSGSMAEEQDQLAAGLARFIAVLEEEPGAPLDLHIGVTSSDLGAGPFESSRCHPGGDGGRLLVPPPERGCPPVDGRFLVDVAAADGSRVTNYPEGQLAEALSCMARLGTGGCGFEQPLAAARRALDGSNGENAGFLREGALLAVFFITDEDDCSAADPSIFDPAQDDRDGPLGELSSFRCFEFGVECRASDPRVPGPRTDCRPDDDSPYLTRVGDLADFLLERKRSPALVQVGGIFGDAAPVAVEEIDGRLSLADVCPAPDLSASPAIRLHAAADDVPAPPSTASLCQPDPSSRAAALASATSAALRATHCLRRTPVDSDPDAAGLQPSCRAYHVTTASRRELPLCRAAGPDLADPCFTVESDPDACSFTDSHLAARLHAPAGSGDRLQLECIAEPPRPPGSVD